MEYLQDILKEYRIMIENGWNKYDAANRTLQQHHCGYLVGEDNIPTVVFYQEYILVIQYGKIYKEV
jgi:hypothetical protein